MTNTIARYPLYVEIPAQPFGWRKVAWADFAAANPDIAEDVACDLVIYGSSRQGGGAAPEITILRG